MKKYLDKILILFSIILSCCLILACSKDKPLDLGYFTKVGDLSLSSDGSQILFTGCGHKDYRKCTIYRFDRSADKLYRYIPRDERIEVIGGRYVSDSMRFIFAVIPVTKEDKRQYEDMQIALINQDGTGYTQLTKGKGMKVGYKLGYDEKILVYFRGKERKSGRTMASDFDLYKLDLATNKETQLTNLSFYGVSIPYFTPDGKDVVFGGDTPLRLPHTNNIDIVKQFEENYKQKYKENIILKYPLDGSGIDKEPVPMFTFGIGSREPMVTRDGSVWFEGISRGIRYCRRIPDGKIVELTYGQLGIGRTVFLLRMVIEPNGKWMAILYEERKSTGHVLKRSIGMYNVATTERSELAIPATAENILIK